MKKEIIMGTEPKKHNLENFDMVITQPDWQEVKGKIIAQVLSDSAKIADTLPDSLAKGFASGEGRNEPIKEEAISNIVGITLKALSEEVTVKITSNDAASKTVLESKYRAGGLDKKKLSTRKLKPVLRGPLVNDIYIQEMTSSLFLI